MVYHRYPKLGVVCGTDDHFIFAFHAGCGPRPDVDEFRPLVADGLAERNIHPVTPTRRNAKIKQHGNSSEAPLVCDEAIRSIRRRGRKSWKASVDYHRRRLAETAMHRMKGCFGSLLKNREFPHQRTEARLHSKILHHFAHLGLPQFEWS